MQNISRRIYRLVRRSCTMRFHERSHETEIRFYSSNFIV